MSALPPKADISLLIENVRFVPTADMVIAEWLKRGSAEMQGPASRRPFSLMVIGALAAECRSPTIHLGLSDLARPDQRRDTCVVQPVAMPAHTVFQASGFETPLATKPAIIVRTMPRVTVPCLGYAARANNQCKGNEQYCPIILHAKTLLWAYSRTLSDRQSCFFEGRRTPCPFRKFHPLEI
jgi:hypothetical protein